MKDLDKLAARLKETTLQAINRAEILKKKKEEEQRIIAEKQKAENELKAMSIIEKIPDIAEKAALDKKFEAVVMKLTAYKDYKTRDEYSIEKIDLKGVAELVYLACEKAKLNPKIDFWHDGIGMDSGYQITINWS